MSENKTRPTGKSVDKFLQNVEHPRRKEDSFTLMKIMKEITKEEPVMWGPSIVGFGSHHYKYKTGREGDMPKVAFAPRKSSMTLYVMPGFDDYRTLLSKLGKHKTGKACLYINKLSDVNLDVLKEIIRQSYAQTEFKY